MNHIDLPVLPQFLPLQNSEVRAQHQRRKSCLEERRLAMESIEESYANTLNNLDQLSMTSTEYQPSLATSPLAIPEVRSQHHRRMSELEERRLIMDSIEADYAAMLSRSFTA
ncbi:hypothetical protein K7432_007144 [Basidiobolus ranarum]|uniref:Uncharacterized protein n=1 Tax=Basidiobolus ranarum TaxID=34480 RepID=A0ABR2W0J4_9FUNG